jgi:MscS family membrane protein
MENIVNFIDNLINNFSLSNLPISRYVVAVFLFLFFLLLRRVFALFVIKVLKKYFSKTENKIDDKSIKILLGPIGFIFIIVGFNAFLIMAGIENEITRKISKTLVVFDIFWFLFYMVELFNGLFTSFTKNYSKALSNEIVKFLTRFFKLIVVSIAIMSMLQVWDINVSGFVASLGLGGLAFALAAKDTAANIFGSLAIIADKAISVGEWIEVDGVEGIVVDIGMRTTKIRSFENAIITMPNQIIANTKIINYSRRRTRRVKFRIGLTYDTTQKEMQNIISQIKEMLNNHPQISKKDPLIVNFDRFSDSSLDIFLYFFTDTSNWQEYLEIKEDINLNIIKIVKENGADFAFPTQTIYLERES